MTPALARHLFLGRHEKSESGSNTLDRSVKSPGGQKGIYMLGRFQIGALLLDQPSLCKLDLHTPPFSSDMGQNTRTWVLIHPVSSFPSHSPYVTALHSPIQLFLCLSNCISVCNLRYRDWPSWRVFQSRRQNLDACFCDEHSMFYRFPG